MSGITSSPRFTMVGSPDEVACHGDACLLPVATPTPETSDIQIEPDDALLVSARTAKPSRLDPAEAGTKPTEKHKSRLEV